MAMLKNKQITFSLILVCLILVSPMANAALGGLLGTIGGLVGTLLGDILPIISGVVYCTVNGSPNGHLSGTAPHHAVAFANAKVQLQCGEKNTVVSNSTTSAAGLFLLSTDPKYLSKHHCKLVVMTPLARCNASLPGVGSLVSELSVIGTSASGAIKVVNIAPTAFHHLN